MSYHPRLPHIKIGDKPRKQRPKGTRRKKRSRRQVTVHLIKMFLPVHKSRLHAEHHTHHHRQERKHHGR